MFEQSKDGATFSPTPTKEESWLTRLKPNKAPAAPPKWPNPQDSVGKLCCGIDGLKFWEVKDPGRAKLAPLEVEVQKFLKDHHEYWKDREASNLSFSIFMVGRHEKASSPTLVIISANKKSRQMVVQTIRGSGILDKYEGVLLGASSKHPRYPTSGPPRCIALDSDNDSSHTFPIGVGVYVEATLLAVTPGTSIYIPFDPTLSEEVSRFRKATLGGFITLRKANGESTIVGITVGHAFREESRNEVGEEGASDQTEASDDELFEFEFDDATPSGIFLNDNKDTKSWVLKPWRTPNRSHQISSHLANETEFVSEKGSKLKKLGIKMKTSLEIQSNLDWALIQITAKNFTFSNIIASGAGKSKDVAPKLNFSSFGKDAVSVIARTGSKLPSIGLMSGSSTYLKMEHSNTFEEVNTVTLGQKLSYGDSGSWVLETKTGRVCGHIVAGDLSTGLAYVMPAKAVFGQIERQLECRIELPEEGSLFPVASSAGEDLTEIKQETEKEKEKDIVLPRSWRADVPGSGTTGPKQHQGSIALPYLRPATAESGTTQNKEASTDTQLVSMMANMKTGSWEDRVRNRERDARAARTSVRANEYFVPGDGIDHEVITADICRYLGNDALVRRGTYVNPQTGQSQEGYFITAYRNLTTGMIADLKADSNRWADERRSMASKERNVEYRTSTTHQSRQYYGSTETVTARPLGYQQPASTPAGTVYASAPGGYQPQSYPLSQPAYYAAPAYAVQDSSNYYATGANIAVDARDDRETSVPVTQPPTPRSNVQYTSSSTTYPQGPDSWAMHYLSTSATQTGAAAPSAQYPIQSTDPYYGRAIPASGIYDSQDTNDDGIYQDSSADSQPYQQIDTTPSSSGSRALQDSSGNGRRTTSSRSARDTTARREITRRERDADRPDRDRDQERRRRY